MAFPHRGLGIAQALATGLYGAGLTWWAFLLQFGSDNPWPLVLAALASGLFLLLAAIQIAQGLASPWLPLLSLAASLAAMALGDRFWPAWQMPLVAVASADILRWVSRRRDPRPAPNP